MGQDKQQLSKLLAFVKDLYENPDNKEFAAGIQSLVLSDFRSGINRDTCSKQINEIYELCLKKNLREQAEDLYKDFPLIEIASELVKNYVEMENARRANDFDSFGRYLYLQIELIVNTIINDIKFREIYAGLRDMKPLTYYNKEKKETYRTDFTQYKDGKKIIKETVHKFLMTHEDSIKKEGIDSIESIYAKEKYLVVLYTVCYKATMNGWPTDESKTFDEIYVVRNNDSHTGGVKSDWQKETYEKLSVDKTKNYLKFLSFLLTFIKGISANYPYPDDLFLIAGVVK